MTTPSPCGCGRTILPSDYEGHQPPFPHSYSTEYLRDSVSRDNAYEVPDAIGYGYDPTVDGILEHAIKSGCLNALAAIYTAEPERQAMWVYPVKCPHYLYMAVLSGSLEVCYILVRCVDYGRTILKQAEDMARDSGHIGLSRAFRTWRGLYVDRGTAVDALPPPSDFMLTPLVNAINGGYCRTLHHLMMQRPHPREIIETARALVHRAYPEGMAEFTSMIATLDSAPVAEE